MERTNLQMQELRVKLESVFAETIIKFPMVKNYTITYTQDVRRLGYCDYQNKVIGISLNHIKLSEEHLVIDTLLHEVAHAVAQHRARLNGVRIKAHGFEWRSACLEVGAKPERCKTTAYTLGERPQQKYTLTCNTCGHTSGLARWSGNRRYSCSACTRKNGGSGFNPNYLMTITKNY